MFQVREQGLQRSLGLSKGHRKVWGKETGLNISKILPISKFISQDK